MSRFDKCFRCGIIGHNDGGEGPNNLCPSMDYIRLNNELEAENLYEAHQNGNCDCRKSDEPGCELQDIMEKTFEDDNNQFYYENYREGGGGCECKTCLCILTKLKLASASHPVEAPHPDGMELLSSCNGSVDTPPNVVGTTKKRKCKTCGIEGHDIADVVCPFSVENLPFHDRNISIVNINYQCDNAGDDDSDDEDGRIALKRQRLE